jgi:hypothetical protein
MSLSQFIEYCLSFYGPGGVYPLGMSSEEVSKAVRLLDLIGQKELDLDSIDRERCVTLCWSCEVPRSQPNGRFENEYLPI